MPPPCITFCCAAASRIHHQPPFYVRASWLSLRISSHHLCLLTRRRLTTGCVIAVTDMQALLPSMCRRHCRCRDCDCCPRHSLSSGGVAALVVVVVVVVVVNKVHHHCHHHCIPLRCRNHRQLCRLSRCCQHRQLCCLSRRRNRCHRRHPSCHHHCHRYRCLLRRHNHGCCGW